MTAFIDLIYNLEYLGIADVLLPFFLVFTVVFAVLEKSHVLGKGDNIKRYNVILALSMAFAVVIPHVLGRYPPGMNVVLIINNALPQVSVVLIAIVMLLLMLGVFGLRWPGADTENNGGSLIVIASLLIIIYIFTTSAGMWGVGFPYWLWFLGDPQTQSVIITLLVFGVVVWFITKDDSNKEKKEKSKTFIPMRIEDE